LTDAECTALETLVRAHTTAQHLAQRARIILAAAAGQNNSAIARTVGLDVDTVRAWRRRWLQQQAVSLTDRSVTARLADAPRSGAPPRLTAEQVCRIVAVACAGPRDAARPISHWSARELADEAVAQGIVDRLSPRHAGRLLKRGISSRTASATG
jgi:putative transposase